MQLDYSNSYVRIGICRIHGSLVGVDKPLVGIQGITTTAAVASRVAVNELLFTAKTSI